MMWEWFGKPTYESVKADIAEVGLNLWDDWFIQMIPDLAGYGTLLAGGWMMIGSMFSDGAIGKALGLLSAGLIVSVCILGVA